MSLNEAYDVLGVNVDCSNDEIINALNMKVNKMKAEIDKSFEAFNLIRNNRVNNMSVKDLENIINFLYKSRQF